MSVLVTGASGQLGREFCRQLGDSAVAADLPELDITNGPQVRAWIAQWRPFAVINCAAYTQVDRAEAEPKTCAAVNSDAVRHLAAACQAFECRFLQISTDYVFGGDPRRDRPYSESDPPRPQSVYARTKLQGEIHATLCPRHFIIRTCGLFGQSPRNNNFVETMLRLAQAGRRLRIVNDQHCSPSSVSDVARAALFLLTTEHYGTYHIVNSGQTTWYEFAREIFRVAGVAADVEPITTSQYGAPAARPAYSVLDTTKYHACGGPRMPTWQTALAEYLAARSRS